MSNKYQLKDIMNVGIFVVLYYVTFFAAMCLGYIPFFMSILSLVSGIMCGIPFMLFLTKVKKFGLVLLFGTICGLISLLMGSGVLPLITAVIASLFSALILFVSKYRLRITSIFAYAVFTLWNLGYGLRLYLSTASTFTEGLKESYGSEYVSEMLNYALTPGLWISILTCFVGGILGGILGYFIFQKHFRKAGLGG